MRPLTRPDGPNGPTGPLTEHSAGAILSMTAAIALGAGVAALALTAPVAVALGLASMMTIASVVRLAGGDRPTATAGSPVDDEETTDAAACDPETCCDSA
ncbi:MAG: hypothetical protein ABEJ67_00595 [Halanaeroarchaeum sp.]